MEIFVLSKQNDAEVTGGYSVGVVDGGRGEAFIASALSHVLSNAASEPELAVRPSSQLVPRLTRLPASTSGAVVHESASTQLITGGTGGLGLLTARWLAQSGAAQAVVRSGAGRLAGDLAPFNGTP